MELAALVAPHAPGVSGERGKRGRGGDIAARSRVFLIRRGEEKAR